MIVIRIVRRIGIERNDGGGPVLGRPHGDSVAREDAARRPGEEVAAVIRGGRGVDDAQNGPAIDKKGHGDGGAAKALQEVMRAVMRIDHPAGCIAAPDRCGLLSEPAAGFERKEALLEHRLDLRVDVGMIASPARFPQAVEFGAQNLARFVSGRDDSWEKGKHGCGCELVHRNLLVPCGEP